MGKMHRKRNELVRCQSVWTRTDCRPRGSGADKGKWIGPNEGAAKEKTTKPGVNGRESNGGGSNGNGSRM